MKLARWSLGIFNSIKELITKKEKPETNKQKESSYEDIYPKIIDTEHLYSYNYFSRSADKSYIIAYSEHPQGGYALLKDNQIMAQGNLPRPAYCSVANNGTFIINNWGVATNLCGIFYAFNNQGELILKREFKANLYNNEISNDGHYAVCQTCNSKYEDSNQLLFFDLKEGKLLWSVSPLPGWASSYQFDLENKQLILNYEDQPSYRYSFSGIFLDKDKLIEDTFNHLTPSEKFFTLEKEHREKLEQFSEDELKIALISFKELLNSEITEVKYKHARTHRYIGEIYLKLNKKAKALNHFEEALEVSSRVGVKRVKKQLTEELKDAR